MRLAAALAAAVALLVSGCGDDEEGGFSPVVSEPVSKVEFLRQADQICNAAESQIEAAADDLITAKEEPSPEEVEEVAINIVVPALKSEVAAIGALGAPEGDEDQVQGIIDATEAGIAEIEADPAALLDGAPPSLQEAEKLAREYGSQQCGIR